MSPWRLRLALRRSRVQLGLIAVVLLVSSTAASLLSALYLLDYATSTSAARAVLTSTDPEDREIRFTVKPAVESAVILDGTDKAAATLLAGVPSQRTADLMGASRVVPTADDSYVVGYLASSPTIQDATALLDGRWPERADARAVEVAVPAAFANDLDMRVGHSFELTESTSEDEGLTAIIVGIYVTEDNQDRAFRADPLHGKGYSGSVAVPGSSAGVTAPGYGPLLTLDTAVDVTGASTIDVRYIPEVDALTVSELASLRDRLATAQETVTRQLGPDATRVDTSAALAARAGSITSSVAMTRSSVLVTALLLVVLSSVALVQTARLVLDRRASELHLLAARGASAGQVVALGLIEAVVMGAVTVVAGVGAGKALFVLLGRDPDLAAAGFDKDPGTPAGVWLAAGVVAMVLVLVLVSSLLKREASLAQAEQSRARPGNRAAFQRTGLDLGVLALAALALWQLKMYKSPVAGSGAKVDWLLSSGPALALFAGGLVAARLVPLLARLLERLAGRGRSATGPLAAWEVGRRPGKAIAAVLLLTLAVSIGTFAMAFSATWARSQEEQALFTHPQDAIAEVGQAAWFDQRETLENGPRDAPVVMGASEVSNQDPASLWLGNEGFRGIPAALLATTDEGWAVYDQGRLDEIRGYALGRELAWSPEESASPIALDTPLDALGLRVSAKVSLTSVTDVMIGTRALLQNDAGDVQSLDLGFFPADTATHEISGALPSPTSGLSVVGLQFSMASTGQAELTPRDVDTNTADVTVTIEALGAVSPAPGWSIANQEPPGVLTAVDSSLATEWTKTSTGGVLKTIYQEDDSTILNFSTTLAALQTKAVSTVVTAAPQTGPVPVVMNGGLLSQVRAKAQDEGSLRIGTTTVKARFVGTVPSIASIHTDVTAVPLTALQLAVFQAGGTVPPVTHWWLGGDNAAQRAMTLDPAATSRQAVTDSLANAPLRVAIPTAITVVVLASAILAALGFAIHVLVSTRARELELAQLTAVGVSKRQLTTMLAVENSLLAALGLVLGLILGLAIASLVGPLVAFGPDGGPPVPGVIVEVPWGRIGALATEVALVLGLAVGLAGMLVKRIDAASLLRQGDAR